MDEIPPIIGRLERGDVRFRELVTICERCFGAPRVRGSHHIFRTPWPGDPRVNLQADKGGKAKRYQVRQVIAALARVYATRGGGGKA